MTAPRHRHFAPRPPARPRARGWLDSWALAVTLTVAVHIGLIGAGLPRTEPAGSAPIPSFTLLPGAPGLGALPGDDGSDDLGVIAQDELPRIATVAPPELVQAVQPHDLPRGGTMPVRLPDRSKERARLLEALDREQRLRAALDAVGTPGADGGRDGVPRTGGGQGGDPELHRWSTEVEGLFREAFHPLVATDRDLVASYLIDFDPRTGAVLGFRAHARSGERAYDAAVERAIRTVRVIPLPPERLAPHVGTRLLIDFHPPAR